ncbi:hypothetical protein PENSPDRAFT_659940 [Peniophora sp. CONT]|nr:hypothetical protein PENSPDRAFT_659940 [Peniophora sp. CONT]
MEEYSRAVSRVYTALCALKDTPESSQVAHARDFVVELWDARDLRHKHKLPRSPFIYALTQMIALRCKQPGAADLDPELFAEEIRAFEAAPPVQLDEGLGDNQWWSALPRKIVPARTRTAVYDVDMAPSPPSTLVISSTHVDHTLPADDMDSTPPPALLDSRLTGSLKRDVPDSEIDCANSPPRKIAKLCSDLSGDTSPCTELETGISNADDPETKYPKTLGSPTGFFIQILTPKEVQARMDAMAASTLSSAPRSSPTLTLGHESAGSRIRQATPCTAYSGTVGQRSAVSGAPDQPSSKDGGLVKFNDAPRLIWTNFGSARIVKAPHYLIRDSGDAPEDPPLVLDCWFSGCNKPLYARFTQAALIKHIVMYHDQRVPMLSSGSEAAKRLHKDLRKAETETAFRMLLLNHIIQAPPTSFAPSNQKLLYSHKAQHSHRKPNVRDRYYVDTSTLRANSFEGGNTFLSSRAPHG